MQSSDIDPTQYAVTSNLDGIADAFFGFSNEIKMTLMVRSLNEIGSKMATKIRRSVRDETGLKIRSIKPKMVIKKANASTHEYVIKIRDYWFTIDHPDFKPLQEDEGVEAYYYGNRVTFPGTFLRVVNGKRLALMLDDDSEVKSRETPRGSGKYRTRHALRRVFAFNIADQIIRSKIVHEVMQEFPEMLAERYVRKLDQYTNKPIPVRQIGGRKLDRYIVTHNPVSQIQNIIKNYGAASLPILGSGSNKLMQKIRGYSK